MAVWPGFNLVIGGSLVMGASWVGAGGTFRMGMCLLGAPQLSEQINQMIVRATHHWCNSRIDKCCSLRLIQRHIITWLGVAAAAVCASLWL